MNCGCSYVAAPLAVSAKRVTDKETEMNLASLDSGSIFKLKMF